MTVLEHSLVQKKQKSVGLREENKWNQNVDGGEREREREIKRERVREQEKDGDKGKKKNGVVFFPVHLVWS